MFVNAQLPALRTRWGRPFHLWMTQEFDEKGWFLVQKSISQGRTHDVTLFIRDVGGRFALMSKHSYPPGVFRSPSGGVNPGEPFEKGALREAKEETGLDVELQKFLLHVTLDITHDKELARWETLVFSAATTDERLAFTDSREVREARWATQRQLEEINLKLRETGNGGLLYRAKLTESYLWTLEHPLTLRDAPARDMAKIEASPAGKDPRVGRVMDHHWWSADVHGLYGGAVGVRRREDCLELLGLNVHPMFRGRGIGHALIECAVDQLHQEKVLDSLGPGFSKSARGGLFAIADSTGYFMPCGFRLARPSQIPPSLAADVKALGIEESQVVKFSPA